MNERASKEALFHVVRQLVPTASLARTLAEALFWMQHAQRFDGGLPTIWKTGRELSEALGIHPRTANTHMKDLAKLQLIVLRYRPKPGGVSPVSWLTATPTAIELIERARTAGSTGRLRRTKSVSVEQYGKRPSAGECRDTRTSEAVTGIHYDQQLDPQEDGNVSFIATPEQKHGNITYLDEDTLEPPKHLNVSPQARAFVMLAQKVLRSRSLPRWDPKSQYTWINARRFADVLSEAGISGPEACEAFLGRLFDQWTTVLWSLPKRYRDYEDNAQRPSPRALGDLAMQVVGHVQAEGGWKSTGGGMDDFC